jgi:hypothetical protein
MAELKRIVCGQPNRPGNPDGDSCIGILAHQISPRMVVAKRAPKNEQEFTMVGDQWSLMLTCPKCLRKTSIVCNHGKIEESELHYVDESKVPPPKPDDNDTDPPTDPAKDDDTPPADPAEADPPADPPKEKEPANA